MPQDVRSTYVSWKYKEMSCQLVERPVEARAIQHYCFTSENYLTRRRTHYIIQHIRSTHVFFGTPNRPVVYYPDSLSHSQGEENSIIPNSLAHFQTLVCFKENKNVKSACNPRTKKQGVENKANDTQVISPSGEITNTLRGIMWTSLFLLVWLMKKHSFVSLASVREAQCRMRCGD